MTSTATAIRPAPAFAESVGVGAARGAARLWHSLMLARVVLGVLLAIAVLALFVWSGASKLMVAVCVGYAALAIAVRAKGVIPTSPAHFDRLWPQSVGIDVLAFASIHSAQLAGLNFAPLFIVPVLTAAMLGSNTLSMATAAGVSIFLLAEAWWFVPFGAEVAPRLLQAGLYGMGFFGLALTAQPLAQRLAQEENLARTSENLVRMQTLVNQLVIEGMSDGVLLVDGNGVVHSLNPAANRMFESPLGNQRTAPFVLAGEAAWREVAQLVATSVQMGDISEELSIQWPEVPARRLLAKTRWVAAPGMTGLALCVVYLEDLRDIEARVRTEKLAAMGRMSAAVAHEIRNPLAAITQANGLLAEGELAGTQPRLVRIIHDNARRLGRIVDDVLSVSRGPKFAQDEMRATLDLDAEVVAIVEDWRAQAGMHRSPDARLSLMPIPACVVHFEAEHLRQILVNLLDNASRYASNQAGAIRVFVALHHGHASLSVWSDGGMIDLEVQAHLFEPFSSSESRTSGLGLFISRELCERHGASISYRRAVHGGIEGNQFEVFCRLAARLDVQTAAAATTSVKAST